MGFLEGGVEVPILFCGRGDFSESMHKHGLCQVFFLLGAGHTHSNLSIVALFACMCYVTTYHALPGRMKCSEGQV